MAAENNNPFKGGFDPQKPPRAKSLSSAQHHTQSGMPFRVQPGSSTSSMYEGAATHAAPAQGTVWTQQYAKSDTKYSTKYEKLFPAISVTDLTRANKALVHGGSDTLVPQPNTWHGKQYSEQGMMAASLLRINETTTAFGAESMGNPQMDAGAGMMASVLARKWAARSADTKLGNMDEMLGPLTAQFPQLDTVDKMRKAGPKALVAEIASSRFEAAVQAGQRALAKGLKGHQIGEYVQKKFSKHGLGSVPGGWAEELRKRNTGSG